MSEKVDKVPIGGWKRSSKRQYTATLLCAPQTIYGSSKKKKQKKRIPNNPNYKRK